MWLHSSVGRASHRYRGGHGFESRWRPVFFFLRLLLSNCLNWKIYCNDHSSLLSTTAVLIWIAWFVLLTLIHWIVIYPVDSVIQPLNNWGWIFSAHYFLSAYPFHLLGQVLFFFFRFLFSLHLPIPHFLFHIYVSPNAVAAFLQILQPRQTDWCKLLAIVC